PRPGLDEIHRSAGHRGEVERDILDAVLEHLDGRHLAVADRPAVPATDRFPTRQLREFRAAEAANPETRYRAAHDRTLTRRSRVHSFHGRVRQAEVACLSAVEMLGAPASCM